MKIEIPTMNGFIPDCYSKFANEDQKIEGKPSRSFPIFITDAPDKAKTLAVYFRDFDSVPVCGFTWIHWLAANLPVQDVPANISHSKNSSLDFVQGNNSNISKFLGKNSGPVEGYTGPMPPDKTHYYTLTVYALDTKLDLKEGYWLNDFLRKMEGHIIDSATISVPSRAK
ncbi:YbhB/YbcL family Raf kinase inhibitor-like protein [Lactobacillus johnsonii]|uniref:YbhB/YbcL family Raf kinase inhibitor-like protein n=1 Tax=Lactobacillus johnsonii TaxID=33959 RepID=UPI003D7799CD